MPMPLVSQLATRERPSGSPAQQDDDKPVDPTGNDLEVVTFLMSLRSSPATGPTTHSVTKTKAKPRAGLSSSHQETADEDSSSETACSAAPSPPAHPHRRGSVSDTPKPSSMTRKPRQAKAKTEEKEKEAKSPTKAARGRRRGPSSSPVVSSPPRTGALSLFEQLQKSKELLANSNSATHSATLTSVAPPASTETWGKRKAENESLSERQHQSKRLRGYTDEFDASSNGFCSPHVALPPLFLDPAASSSPKPAPHPSKQQAQPMFGSLPKSTATPPIYRSLSSPPTHSYKPGSAQSLSMQFSNNFGSVSESDRRSSVGPSSSPLVNPFPHWTPHASLSSAPTPTPSPLPTPLFKPAQAPMRGRSASEAVPSVGEVLSLSPQLLSMLNPARKAEQEEKKKDKEKESVQKESVKKEKNEAGGTKEGESRPSSALHQPQRSRSMSLPAPPFALPPSSFVSSFSSKATTNNHTTHLSLSDMSSASLFSDPSTSSSSSSMPVSSPIITPDSVLDPSADAYKLFTVNRSWLSQAQASGTPPSHVVSSVIVAYYNLLKKLNDISQVVSGRVAAAGLTPNLGPSFPPSTQGDVKAERLPPTASK